MNNKSGFTLIELIMIIVIIGILAIVAIPQYRDLSNQANQAAEDGVVGAVRSGILASFAQNRVFPATLDTVAAGGSCIAGSPCFDNVLAQGGLSTGGWTKNAAGNYVAPDGTVYVYSGPPNGTFQ